MVIVVTVLAVLAVVLAWPVPLRLARADWARRHPAAGLVLWQAVGLAGGLALLTAELSLAAVHRPGSWRGAVGSIATRPGGLGLAGTIGLAAFLLTGAWLIGVLVASTLRVAAARRRHRYVLDLLAVRDAEVPGDVSVLTHAGSAAYSIPGRRSRIVVSRGACEALDEAQLRAVVEHERAHLRQHHDVVVQPFVAWRNSFPFLSAAGLALRSVEELTEFLADDAARARAGDRALGEALSVMASAEHPVDARRDRLARPGDGTTRTLMVAGLLACVIVLAPPILLATVA